MHPVYILSCCLLVFLSGCAAQTGIPGHGGGKRFAVEQELVAAAARSAIKQLDLSSIKGKKVNLYVNTIGDTGAGNLVGGRFSIISQLSSWEIGYFNSSIASLSNFFNKYFTSLIHRVINLSNIC